MHRHAAVLVFAALVPVAAGGEESTGAAPMNHAYAREARLAGRALEAQDAAGALGNVVLEVAELSPAEAMPVSTKEGAWSVWTFSTRATKDADVEPAVRFVLVPRAGTMAWRSTLDTMGSWLEPELFFIDDEFAVFSRRGPSLSDEVVAAREAGKKAVARLLGREDDPGQECVTELSEKGLLTGVADARKHLRHLAIDADATGKVDTSALGKAYPLYWISVAHTPEEGLESVAWTAPAGLAASGPRDPREAGLPPDASLRDKTAAAEASVAEIGLRLVEKWKGKPQTPPAERRTWVEQSATEIQAAYEKAGALIPGSNRHELDMKRFARYLAVLD